MTVSFAGGALFIQFKLASSRADVERMLEDRFGAHLQMGEVSVNGLRGLRIDDLEITFADSGGPHLDLRTPIAYVDLNLNALLYGTLTVERILVDYSQITLSRPEEVDWYDPEKIMLDSLSPLEAAGAFRISGKFCDLSIVNVIGDTRIDLTRFSFDVSRLEDADDLVATFAGDLSGDASKHLKIKLTFTDVEDFDLRLQADLLTAEDINIFLPSPNQLVQTGQIRPTIWINGRPDNRIVVSLQAPFEGVTVVDQSEYLKPAEGVFNLLATYEVGPHLLSITAARADSEQFGGTVDGSISFAGPYPEFDLTLTATHLPIADILNDALEGRVDKYGEMLLTLNEPHELIVTLRGTSEAPVVEGRASAGSGRFQFRPTNPDYPELDLVLGSIDGMWDSENRSPTATFIVVDGTIDHKEIGIQASRVYGTVAIEDRSLLVSPFNAIVTGNPMTGDFSYDLDSDDASFTVEGKLSGIESISFARSLEGANLSGAISGRCKGTKRGEVYSLDAEIDASQALFSYSWWFRKPVGIGANGTVRVDYTDGESAIVEVEAVVASSNLDASAVFLMNSDNTFSLESCQASADTLDVDAVATCLTLPYKISGGTATDGHFLWERLSQFENGSRQTLGCRIDDISIIPDSKEATTPIVCKDLTLLVTFQDRPTRTGTLELQADDAQLPSFGEVWFVPLNPDSELPPRAWTYTLAANTVELPPWMATSFTGSAYSNAETSGFYAYAADIENGHIQGDYHLIQNENVYSTEITWKDIPAHYLIDHLKYDSVLQGNVTGGVRYSVDLDDPDTLEGTGSFAVDAGKFSADFLYSILKGRSGDELASLPPLLEFDELSVDVIFEKDIVRTPTLHLVSEGLVIHGEGQYIRDGDMDYLIDIAVTPERAEQIPILSENFNLQGLRLTQQKVELSFRIDGPTFNPRGQLADLPPVSVTLVSGAFDVASEAVKVIDMPRRILIDLLKIGGGIVSTGR